MGVAISERLGLIIEAKADQAVRELKKPVVSLEQLAVTEDKAALTAARLEAANDKLAVSTERLSLIEAKAAGNSEKIAASQASLASAQDKASVSKAGAAVAADKLAADEAKAAAAAKGLGSEASGASGLLSKLGLSGLSSAGSLETLVPVAIAAAAALGFKTTLDGVEKLESLGHTVLILQGVLGGTAAKASLLSGQFKQLSIDPEAGAKALARLGAAIGDGSTKLGEFDVEVARNKDGTADLYGTLDNLRNAYNGSADAATRDAIAKQLGLRNATALIPLLRLTNDEVAKLNRQTRDSGGVMSQGDVDRAHELSVTSKQLHQDWDNIEIGLAKAFLPALNLAAKVAGELLKEVKQVEDVGLFVTGVTPINDAINAFESLTGKTSKHSGAAKTDASANQDDAASLDAVTSVAEKLTGSLTGLVSARNAVVDTQNAAVDAGNREIDAQQSLDQLLAKGAVDEDKVASAKETHNSASQTLARALRDETKASADLAVAQQRATDLELSEARNKIDLAGDSTVSANAAVQQAQEKLDALLGGGSASAGEIAAAQAELKTKQDQVTKSINDQADARNSLTDLEKKGTDQDPKVLDARQRLEDAHQGVADATDRERISYGNLVKAEAPDPDFAHKLAEARQAVAEAHQSTKEAMDAEAAAGLASLSANDQYATALNTDASAVKSVRDELQKLKDLGFPVDLLQVLLEGPQSGPAGGEPGFEAPPSYTYGAGDTSKGYVPTGPTTPSASPVNPTHRALGGQSYPDGDYLFGDRGPELVRMGRAQTGTATPVSIGGGGTTLVQKFYGYDTRWVADRASREAALRLSNVLPPRVGAPA